MAKPVIIRIAIHSISKIDLVDGVKPAFNPHPARYHLSQMSRIKPLRIFARPPLES